MSFNEDFYDLVSQQIELLNSGLPLAAFDQFYAEDIKMYANDILFAKGKKECRQKQEPFILPCIKIEGLISKKHIDAEGMISVIHNQTSFEHPEKGRNQINGVHVQHWKNSKIFKELYYHGDMLEGALKKWLP